MLRVLQVKAVAGEAAAEVADGVMRVCGARRSAGSWGSNAGSATRWPPG